MLIFTTALIFFVLLGAVSASVDENITVAQEQVMDDATGAVADDSEIVLENKSVSFTVSDDKNYIKGDDFTVKLTDDSSAAVSNKSVEFKINGNTLNSTTDADGNAKLNLNYAKGHYTILYSFISDGFTPINGSKDIMIITTSTPTVKHTSKTAYAGFTNTYEFTLTVGGLALSNRAVTIKVDGKAYNKKTDSAGKILLKLKLAKGTHTFKYSYAGENNINKASGSFKVKVYLGMPVTIKKINSVIYRHKTSAPFKVKLVNAYGNPVANKKVKFTINKKTYTKKTNSNGIISFAVKQSKGSYKLKIVSLKTTYYKKVTKTYTVKVKPKQARNNGLWLLSTDMENVDFKQLKSVGTKHIFLNAKSIERFGQSYVESFIKNASSYGIKTHLWVQVFYENGKWINPIKNGKINYDLLKSKITQTKKFAKVKGISGIHFDYLRFPGTAYKYKYGVNAVNYFTKNAANAVHKINSKLIVSAAVMPEPSSMKYYYGQDIKTMSKYLDVIVPMVYKGNYHAGTKWIQSVTKAFVKQSKGAKIWTGLQTYKSDDDVTKLSASALMNDADAAAMGGAYGVILFRFGLVNYINFNDV